MQTCKIIKLWLAAQPYKLDETPAERVNTWGEATYKYLEVSIIPKLHTTTRAMADWFMQAQKQTWCRDRACAAGPVLF